MNPPKSHEKTDDVIVPPVSLAFVRYDPQLLGLYLEQDLMIRKLNEKILPPERHDNIETSVFSQNHLLSGD